MKYILLLLFALPAIVIADEMERNYRSGLYVKVIDALEQKPKLSNKEKYILGRAYFKNGQYFEACLELESYTGNKAKAYYLGQCYLAQEKFEKSLSWFEKAKEKSDASQFYRGYIYQLQKRYPKADALYMNLAKSEFASPLWRQKAAVQHGNMLLRFRQLKKKKAKRIDPKYIVHLEKVIATSPKSSLAPQLLRIKHLLSQAVDVKKKIGLSFSERIGMDSNVVLNGDDANTSATKQSSLFSATSLDYDYSHIVTDKQMIYGKIETEYEKFLRSDANNITRNNQLILNPEIGYTILHNFIGFSSMFNFGFNYTRNLRETTNSGLDFYRNQFEGYGLASISFFERGKTTIRASMEQIQGYISSLDTEVISGQLIQNLKYDSVVWFFTLGYRSSIYKSQSTNDNISYIARTDAVLKNLFHKISLKPFLQLTLFNPTNQGARGLEQKYQPGFEIERNLGDGFDLTLEYIFTKNKSKSVSFDFTRHQVYTGIELQY